MQNKLFDPFIIEQPGVVDIKTFCFTFCHIFGAFHTFRTSQLWGIPVLGTVYCHTPGQIWGEVVDGGYLVRLANHREVVEVVELSEYLVFGCLEG